MFPTTLAIEELVILAVVILAFALLGLGVWYLEERAASSSMTPDEIAQQRYARGEISQYEYEQIRRTLAKTRHFAG